MQVNGYTIEYRHQNEWHIFTSNQLHGLYVASKDYDTAYNDIQVSIEKLLELNKESHAS